MPIPAEYYSLTQDLWLSSILGQTAFNVQKSVDGFSAEALEKNLLESPCFGSVKLDVIDIRTSVTLEDIGFRHVDTALTFCSCEKLKNDFTCARFAEPKDKIRVAEIAGSSFSSSRFHLDPRIENTKADAIKYYWAENYFNGKRGDGMIVVEDDQKQVQGFCQVLMLQDNTAVIDLIGISLEKTGQGLGSQMVSFLWEKGLGQQKPDKILVGTQAANVGAVKFYENANFRLIKAQNILHFIN